MKVKYWLTLLLLLFSEFTWSAINCNSVFPGPAQSHSFWGNMFFYNSSKINNYSGNQLCFDPFPLPYVSYYANSSSCSNGSASCSPVWDNSNSYNAPSFPTDSDSSSYTVASWYGAISNAVFGSTNGLGKYNSTSKNWDIGNVTIYSTSSGASFSNNYQSYVFNSLTLSGGVLNLNAGGVYYINGPNSDNKCDSHGLA